MKVTKGNIYEAFQSNNRQMQLSETIGTIITDILRLLFIILKKFALTLR